MILIFSMILIFFISQHLFLWLGVSLNNSDLLVFFSLFTYLGLSLKRLDLKKINIKENWLRIIIVFLAYYPFKYLFVFSGNISDLSGVFYDICFFVERITLFNFSNILFFLSYIFFILLIFQIFWVFKDNIQSVLFFVFIYLFYFLTFYKSISLEILIISLIGLMQMILLQRSAEEKSLSIKDLVGFLGVLLLYPQLQTWIALPVIFFQLIKSKLDRSSYFFVFLLSTVFYLVPAFVSRTMNIDLFHKMFFSLIPLLFIFKVFQNNIFNFFRTSKKNLIIKCTMFSLLISSVFLFFDNDIQSIIAVGFKPLVFKSVFISVLLIMFYYISYKKNEGNRILSYSIFYGITSLLIFWFFKSDLILILFLVWFTYLLLWIFNSFFMFKRKYILLKSFLIIFCILPLFDIKLLKNNFTDLSEYRKDDFQNKKDRIDVMRKFKALLFLDPKKNNIILGNSNESFIKEKDIFGYKTIHRRENYLIDEMFLEDEVYTSLDNYEISLSEEDFKYLKYYDFMTINMYERGFGFSDFINGKIIVSRKNGNEKNRELSLDIERKIGKKIDPEKIGEELLELSNNKDEAGSMIRVSNNDIKAICEVYRSAFKGLYDVVYIDSENTFLLKKDIIDSGMIK